MPGVIPGKVLASSPEEEALTDAELMERLKMGDAQALGPIYERYGGLVTAVIRRQSGRMSDSDAEDICQEVFLTLMSVANRYRPGNTLKGWLCGIALRKARRLKEGSWLRRGLLARFFRPKQEEWTGQNVADQRLDLERILEGLSPPLREVVVLSLVEQLEASEVAAALGISVNAVWTRLHRARARVRELVEEDQVA
jgi:RNA polymerase sigma factor (sigma-70 family)